MEIISREKKDGEVNTFHKNGTKRRNTFYQNDTIISDTKWDDEEHLVYEVKYKDGKRNGTSVDWYTSGKIKTKRTFVNDKLDGEFCEYYVDGTPRGKGKMKGGKMDGKWTYWFHNGKKECELTCKDGEIIKGEVWGDNGDVKVAGKFDHV